MLVRVGSQVALAAAMVAALAVPLAGAAGSGDGHEAISPPSVGDPLLVSQPLGGRDLADEADQRAQRARDVAAQAADDAKQFVRDAAASDPGPVSDGGGGSEDQTGPGDGTPDEVEPVLDMVSGVAGNPVGFVGGQLAGFEEKARRLQEDLQAVVLPQETTDQEEPAPQALGYDGDGGRALAYAVAGMVVAGAVATGGLLFWLGASGTLGTGAASASPMAKDLRRLLPYASPLFTRFEKDTVLGHPKREALYALILQAPGISLQALCDQTGLSRTAVTHHLRLLELQHLIVSKRHGRSRHYFENGGRYGREQKDAYAVLQNGRSKDVASFIREHPGTIQKGLCESMGLQASIAHWHVRRLEEAGLVQAVRRGRTVSYFPTPTLQQAAQRPVPAADALVAPAAVGTA